MKRTKLIKIVLLVILLGLGVLDMTYSGHAVGWFLGLFAGKLSSDIFRKRRKHKS